LPIYRKRSPESPAVVWRGLAEACNNHRHKDSRVYVDSRLKTRSWQDEDGRRHERAEVQANNEIFLDGRGQASTEAGIPEEDLSGTTT
jgi:single-strand DNA-binding protein